MPGRSIEPPEVDPVVEEEIRAHVKAAVERVGPFPEDEPAPVPYAPRFSCPLSD